MPPGIAKDVDAPVAVANEVPKGAVVVCDAALFKKDVAALVPIPAVVADVVEEKDADKVIAAAEEDAKELDRRELVVVGGAGTVALVAGLARARADADVFRPKLKGIFGA